MAGLRLVVHAGDASRRAALVTARVAADRLGARPSVLRGEVERVALTDCASGRMLRAQYDRVEETLSFIVEDPLGAGEARAFSIDADAPALSARDLEASAVAKLDRVELGVGGGHFATYIIGGARRPYFWPVLGPSGSSVVRGQGSADHPHHTGLSVSYGGHSEGGSVNIWSDWDEPPYGPGGRMLHRGFRRLRGGPVLGELTHDLTYLDSNGDAFAEEVRTVRWWWFSERLRVIDLECRVLNVTDRGTRPFLVMVRTPPSFGLPGHGRKTGPEGEIDGQSRTYRMAWIDASGPTAGPPPPPPAGPPEELPDLRASSVRYQEAGRGPWSGIAVLDHPGNDGFPNVVGKYATVQQITQAHYPPADAPDGPFSFRTRVLIHEGSAADAEVGSFAADYFSDCRVELGQ